MSLAGESRPSKGWWARAGGTKARSHRSNQRPRTSQYRRRLSENAAQTIGATAEIVQAFLRLRESPFARKLGADVNLSLIICVAHAPAFLRLVYEWS